MTAAPLLVLLALAGSLDFYITLHSGEMRVAELARVGAQQEVDVVDGAARVLRTLTGVTAIQNMQPKSCSDVARSVADADPRIDMIAVNRRDGVMVCNSVSEQPNINVGDREYFRHAMSLQPIDAPALELIVSRVSGKTAVLAALPMPSPNPDEPPVGVITAAISLNWLSQVAASLPDEARHQALIIDPTGGTVLARSPALQSDKPTTLDPVLVKTLRDATGAGVVEGKNADGAETIYGFAPVKFDTGRLMIVFGIDRNDVLAKSRQRIRVGAALAVTATLITLLIGWIASKVFLLRPLHALSVAVSRLGHGELSARVPVVRTIGELHALAVAFNRMAGRLQARDRQLAQLREKLQKSDEHHRLLADNSSDMITRFNAEFRRTYVSPACRDLLGYEPEELVGHKPGNIVHPDDWLMLDSTLNVPLMAGQGSARATYRAFHKDGASLWLESTGRRLASGDGFVVVTRDVSERKAFEEQLEAANRQLEEMALRDSLTGLSNRRQFDVMLALECRRSVRLNTPLGALIVDIDHFKAYNDAYGHPAGDTCLRAVTGAIKSVLRRPMDMAARLGGEEFAVLLPGTDEAGAAMMAQRVCDAVRDLALPHADEAGHFVTVSVGAAVVMPIDGNCAASLIELADRALYVAKREGRDRVRMAHLHD